ncbi:MAG: hypothetical protein KA144_02935 [Xanthomonadaceae bacterium]|nr:hypothetical protein [Xanthomonadaceae bacterium]
MHTALALAGALTFVVGAVHSVLGEHLIFRRMRQGTLIPTHGKPVLHERHVRILWASWHVVTLFGWAMGAVLLQRATTETPLDAWLEHAIAASMLGGSLLVLIGTRGRHPGWIGLLAVALLVWFG